MSTPAASRRRLSKAPAKDFTPQRPSVATYNEFSLAEFKKDHQKTFTRAELTVAVALTASVTLNVVYTLWAVFWR